MLSKTVQISFSTWKNAHHTFELNHLHQPSLNYLVTSENHLCCWMPAHKVKIGVCAEYWITHIFTVRVVYASQCALYSEDCLILSSSFLFRHFFLYACWLLLLISLCSSSKCFLLYSLTFYCVQCFPLCLKEACHEFNFIKFLCGVVQLLLTDSCRFFYNWVFPLLAHFLSLPRTWSACERKRERESESVTQ